MIYSPACSLYDRTLVWSGRMANDDDEMTFRRDHGAAIGSWAVTIAGIHSRCYAQEALDKLPTFE